MSFAGGPWNNYPMHGIATMAGVLRDDPDALGLVHRERRLLTKHAVGVYGTEPPSRPGSAPDGHRPRSTRSPDGRTPRATTGDVTSRATP